jgi:16S rRNA (adenine1518-N6/adenine1519-N6)-dimethyltransferase
MQFVAKKSLGQNFLNNASVPRKMADAADVGKGDIVLEIGPGTGALTRELLARAQKVIAIEADARAITILNETFAKEVEEGKLVLVAGDARVLDLAALGLRPRAYKVVANIPYYLSGFLFRSFLEHEVQPSTLVFLVQKEVAERIARDEKESLLSLSVKVYGEPRYIETVKKGNFTPQPKVDSAIIAITDISKKRLNGVPESAFFELLHTGFKSRRKQLLGNLTDPYPRDTLVHLFSTLGLPPTVRAEDISFEIWVKLATALSVHKKATKHQRS